MIRLIILEDGDATARYFTSAEITVGRDSSNAVQISSKMASRKHCRIERMPMGCKLVDLSSQNGTSVNGERITQKKLREGDRIEIGQVQIYFQEAPAEILAEIPELRDKDLDKLRRFRADLEKRFRSLLEAAEGELGEDGLRVAENITQSFLDEKGVSHVRRLEEKYAKLLKLQNIIAAINSERDVNRLLTLILDSAIEITSAERGFLITRGDGEFEFSGARNFDREFVRKPIYKISRSIAEQVMRTGEPVITSDAQIDDRFSSILSVADLQLCSVLVLPIKVGTEVLGVFYLDNRFANGVFSEEDLDILTSFAGQTGIALMTARLIEENVARTRALEESNADVERLNLALQEEVERQKQELASLEKKVEKAPDSETTSLRFSYGRIVGRSPAMMEVLTLLDKVIPSDIAVLIQGASGTGKELIARAIHENSPRSSRAFVSENCAAIPETLLESELFGYKKGAFTGADREKVGLFRQAHQGTLFLDEVGDTSPSMQKKLLRALQEGEIRPVGGKDVIHVDVRIISASNKDLRGLVAEGLFREDLLYRLNVITVRIPDLKERREDIPALVDHFVSQISKELRIPKKRVSPEAMLFLMHYDWPGNVRELENEIRKAVTLCDGEIDAEVLSEEIRPREALVQAGGSKTAPRRPGGTLKEIVKQEIEKIEREVIVETLEKAGWNKSESSRVLGISRPTLDAKIAAYGLKKNT